MEFSVKICHRHFKLHMPSEEPCVSGRTLLCSPQIYDWTVSACSMHCHAWLLSCTSNPFWFSLCLSLSFCVFVSLCLCLSYLFLIHELIPVEGTRFFCTRISTGKIRTLTDSSLSLQRMIIFTCVPSRMLGMYVVDNLVIFCYLWVQASPESLRLLCLFIPF